MSQPNRPNYYYNEHKKFPIEYLIIPLLIIGVCYGGYRFFVNTSKARTPEIAASAIMTAIKEHDVDSLKPYVKLTDAESKRLEFHSTPEEIIAEAISSTQASNFKINSFEVLPAEKKDAPALVPIRFTYTTQSLTTPQKAMRKMELIGDQSRWWVTTATLKKFLP